MARQVNCVKLGRVTEGLEQPPFPGAKGQQIFDCVSKQAWQEWLRVQTMLINEHRLASFDPKARKFLEEERTKFLFGGEFAMPEGYVPPKS
jgi:Fe-S cluster biosynthesis and repair protein YggX